MIRVRSKAVNEIVETQRLIGRYTQGRPGATVVITAGIHGNEPAGIFAVRKVLDELEEFEPQFNGELIAYAGNMTALSQGVRFLDKDLNRLWAIHVESGQPASGVHTNGSVEDKELVELLKLISGVKAKEGKPLFFIDLHTTSSESPPFVVIGDSLENREFAKNFPVPIILGIEEAVSGTLLNFIDGLGHIAIGFEGGQHDWAGSIENHVSAIWIALINAGCVGSHDIAKYEKHNKLLNNLRENTARFYEVLFKYEIKDDERFTMRPGFRSFQKVSEGTLLADNQHGAIETHRAGILFMPLYQEKGDDGYFIIRPIRRFWLGVSTVFRKMKLDRFVHLMPGVSQYSGITHAFIVDTKIARWLVIEIFHLLGYRRETVIDGKLVLIKRD